MAASHTDGPPETGAAPAPLHVPACDEVLTQGVRTVFRSEDGLNPPGEHAVAAVARARQYDPAGHVTQAVSPLPDWYEPAEHAAHADVASDAQRDSSGSSRLSLAPHRAPHRARQLPPRLRQSLRIAPRRALHIHRDRDMPRRPARRTLRSASAASSAWTLSYRGRRTSSHSLRCSLTHGRAARFAAHFFSSALNVPS